MIVAANLVSVIVALLLTAPGASAVPTESFAGSNGCAATLASPHPSGGVIKAHMRISCKRKVAQGRVRAQLWRLRFWGWEEIGVPGDYPNSQGGRTFDTAALWKPDAGCYYYRSTGTGQVMDFKGTTFFTPGVGVNFDERYKRGLPPGCGASW